MTSIPIFSSSPSYAQGFKVVWARIRTYHMSVRRNGHVFEYLWWHMEQPSSTMTADLHVKTFDGTLLGLELSTHYCSEVHSLTLRNQQNSTCTVRCSSSCSEGLPYHSKTTKNVNQGLLTFPFTRKRLGFGANSGPNFTCRSSTATSRSFSTTSRQTRFFCFRPGSRPWRGAG